MVNRLLLIFSITLLSYLMVPLAHAAVIDVTPDRTTISINESFKLLFTTTETPDEAPDFSPLKQYFQFIDQRKNTRLSIINGNRSSTTEWTLTLMPKQAGQVMIPSISFGNDSTKPLFLQITDVIDKTADNKMGDALFLKVEVDKTQVYVQSQIIYTTRLYQRIEMLQGSLSSPEIDNAVIEKLSEEDTRFRTEIAGTVYLVTERQYAIFPQQSGEITIPPLVLQANVVDHTAPSRGNDFFSQQSSKTIQVLSDAITLDVLALPADAANSHWLPATLLTLSQTWSNDHLQVTVGEPITRTLTLTAQGITAGQLPEFNNAQHPQLKTYPEQAVRDEQRDNNGIHASLTQKIAIIPTHVGEITLPALTVPWFNVTTQQMETAQLPAITLTAVAAATSGESEVIAESPLPTPAILTPPIENEAVLIPQSNGQKRWQWLALFLGLGWLTTLLLIAWSHYKNPTSTRENTAQESDNNPKQLLKILKHACDSNNPSQVQHALLAWGKQTHGIHNLNELTPYCDESLQQAITQLNQSLYAKIPAAWDGTAFYQAFSRNPIKDTKQPDRGGQLKSLNLLQ